MFVLVKFLIMCNWVEGVGVCGFIVWDKVGFSVVIDIFVQVRCCVVMLFRRFRLCSMVVLCVISVIGWF